MQPKTIAGRYVVERAVGQGGMGTVWLCHDDVLNRQVAVKEVGNMPGESTSDLARALREARNNAALNHRNVISIYDAVEDDDHNWLVMEYLPSRNLSELVAEEGPLSPERVAWMGAQAADGLAAAHARGTVHRDVKPGNILVTDDDHVKISDFGIARTHGEAQLTRSGVVTGTPAFFAPELAKGEEPTIAADVWALGASLYTAVEGRLPYPDQDNAIALLARIASEPPPSPERAEFLTEPIRRMMDPDPSTRWTMADVAHTLHRLHDQHSEQSSGPGTVSLTPPLVEQQTAGPTSIDEPAPVEQEVLPDRHMAPTVQPSSEPDRAGRRAAVAVVGLLAAVAVVVMFVLLDRDDEDPSTADRPERNTATDSDKSTGQAETSEPGGQGDTSTPANRAAPATFVEDYYAHLPDDTETAWALLSPDMQDEVGGYDSYAGFWRTISAVRVEDTTPVSASVVDVEVTYTSDRGTETETRRIRLRPDGDSFLIVGDKVV